MLKITLKNILRYRRRSLLTLAVMIGATFTGFMMGGFNNALLDQLIDGFIRYQTGHIRITTQEYLDNKRFLPVYEHISNVSSVVQEIETIPEVHMAVPTIPFPGIIGHNEESTPVYMVGVDLQRNNYDFPERLQSGLIQSNSVLAGQRLLDKVDASNDSSLLIVSTSAEGGINGISRFVSGTYFFNITAFDRQTLFLDLPSAQSLLKISNAATELLVYLNNEEDTTEVLELLKAQFPDLAIQDYRQQLGGLYYGIVMSRFILNVVLVIVLILSSLVIVNSIVASIYDRIKEIGMMKAMGFRDSELGQMLFYEGLTFGIVGGTIGAILGMIWIWFYSIHGIDVSAAVADTSLPTEGVFFPRVSFLFALWVWLAAVIVPSIVALMPLRMLRRITVVEALNS